MAENSNAATIAADPTVEVNPLSAMNAGVQAARNVTGLRTEQFNLQQSQLQPAYQSMRMLMATNPNPSWDDVNAALAQSARIGGNVNGLVANAAEIAGKGGKPADFMRATGLGGMSPWEQGQLVGPRQMNVSTGAGTAIGTVGGPWSGAGAGQFTTGTFVQQGFTPGEASEFISVPDVDANGRPTGTTHMVPRGTVFGTGVPGSGGGSAAGGGGSGVGGAPLLPPGAPAAAQEARLQQIAQRESGGQNIPNRQGPGGTPLSSASGIYQMIDSTWQHAAQLAGINTQQYPRAINAPPQLQHAAALALMNEQGERPWATSAPGGAGGGGGGGGPPASGPFIGATSAQPVGGGGGVRILSPTGQPVVPGGGGGPILTPPSPYLLPQYEQGAKDYVRDQSVDKTLGQRIAPLQSAIGLVKDNPGLVTGPSAENWYGWVQGLATATGINVGDVHDAGAYQQLVKELGRNLLNNGADPTDMARLMREASQPNPTAQGRQALVTLAAEQIGYERIKSMQYREFRSRHPNDANNNSQFYNQETGDFASDLDPKAVAADLIPQAELASYVRGLSPDAQRRFGQTLKDASRLFKFKIPE